MPRIEFPGFCAPHYDYSQTIFNASQLDHSTCDNLYPETAQQFSRQRHFLIGRPGMSPLLTLAQSPVRGLFVDGTGFIYAVGGTHLYLIGAGPSATDRGAMPSSSGAQPCHFAQMGAGTAPSSQNVMVCDTGVSKLYYWNGTIMVSPFNATALEYLDGFMVAIATGASLQNSNQPNQINVSAFGDLTNWTPGPGATQAFAVRVGGSDLIFRLAVLNSFLWIFGRKTIEIWFNAGLSPFPFQRYQGATLNLGCIAPNSVVKFQNTIVWLGQDPLGYIQVYMAKGMTPVRVSDPAVEGYLLSQSLSDSALLGNAWAYGYQEAGHTFYCLNLYDGSLMLTQSIVYDLTEGIWHTRTYAGVQPIAYAASAINNINGIVGSFSTGQLLTQALNVASDTSTGGSTININYTRNAPYVTDLDKITRHSRFEVFGAFGSNSPTLNYSDDGGVTFPHNYSLKNSGLDQGWNGASFQRYYALQLGRSRARVYQFSVAGTDHTFPVRIGGAYLDVDQGSGR